MYSLLANLITHEIPKIHNKTEDKLTSTTGLDNFIIKQARNNNKETICSCFTVNYQKILSIIYNL